MFHITYNILHLTTIFQISGPKNVDFDARIERGRSCGSLPPDPDLQWVVIGYPQFWVGNHGFFTIQYGGFVHFHRDFCTQHVWSPIIHWMVFRGKSEPESMDIEILGFLATKSLEPSQFSGMMLIIIFQSWKLPIFWTSGHWSIPHVWDFNSCANPFLESKITNDTADGCEILHQLKTLVNIPFFIGFQPSFWWCRISQPPYCQFMYKAVDPKIGLPPVLIHRWKLHEINHPAIGDSPFMETPNGS